MGSCAYAALAHEAVRCRSRGVNLRLVSCQPIVARTIAACGLRRLLPMYTTVRPRCRRRLSDHALTRRTTSRAQPHDSVTPLPLWP